MITTKIETERLILRALSENDAQDLYDIFSDHQVMKYWNCAPWDGLDVATQFIKTSRESMNNNKELTLGIYLKDSGNLLGKIMLFNLEQESRRAEIGFGISRNFWGKGLVFEAASALIEYAFNSLELRRIEAEIDPLNVASGNALERLGFVKEGLLRQRWEIGGVVSDSALFGLLAGEHRTQS
ncbi:putative Acyl-CoA N-acyltransferase [Vibrio nigripulchritudo MADA3029]|uniref:GNAT family N-acetyltransferase n=1 Tax=Vibrio nigripulchritudo TaxID=28173 RepID=UPI0003B216F3|nr:GNAT family N-acetyltransferase [Vibrio nigripulchritudo]CCN49651.1 putative Acyl-CoA N-acyltransferase [Vibrio nigripulchritudo MADA3020]CCN52019.1 putative Acyl-CoA N-acyltransferase [Vibrio nigripulchritudo MADA3021]CCN59380.1 putative Acyl-CoA N-acyltransferase [Vibrio nigripulchritudo MADA3029]